jgi:hypothetical protein
MVFRCLLFHQPKSAKAVKPLAFIVVLSRSHISLKAYQTFENVPVLFRIPVYSAYVCIIEAPKEIWRKGVTSPQNLQQTKIINCGCTMIWHTTDIIRGWKFFGGVVHQNISMAGRYWFGTCGIVIVVTRR